MKRPVDCVLVAEQRDRRGRVRLDAMTRDFPATPGARADRRGLNRQRCHAEQILMNSEAKMWTAHGRNLSRPAKSANGRTDRYHRRVISHHAGYAPDRRPRAVPRSPGQRAAEKEREGAPVTPGTAVPSAKSVPGPGRDLLPFASRSVRRPPARARDLLEAVAHGEQLRLAERRAEE